MTAAKPTQAKQQQGGGFSAIFPFIIIPLLYVVAYIVFDNVFGADSNFVDGDRTKDPLPGNYMGTIYKGGFVVPILLTLLFTVVVFVIERFITLSQARGTGNIDAFVRGIKGFLDRGDINGALAACDKQKLRSSQRSTRRFGQVRRNDENHRHGERRKSDCHPERSGRSNHPRTSDAGEKPQHPGDHRIDCNPDGSVRYGIGDDSFVRCSGNCRRAGLTALATGISEAPSIRHSVSVRRRWPSSFTTSLPAASTP